MALIPLTQIDVELHDYGRTEIPLRDLQKMAISEAPLLAHALQNAERAQQVEIKWGVAGQNVMQIFRVNEAVKDGLQKSKTTLMQYVANAMRKHVREIETFCWHGKLDKDNYCMAGVFQILDRMPRVGDTVRAHVLRPTQIRNLTDPANDYTYQFDIITELTLEVSPAGLLCEVPSYARLPR